MTRRILAPYLRALRRRTALSQDDVAFLLGAFTGTRVSRHETGACVPPLEVVLAYEIIFGTAIGEIYGDEMIPIAAEVRKRAKRLRDSLEHRRRDARREEKRAALKAVIERCTLNPSQ